jgi:hypothetical protein
MGAGAAPVRSDSASASKIERERVGIHALGEDCGPCHVAVHSAEALQPSSDVADIGAECRAAAKLPKTAKEEWGVTEILLAIIARHSSVIDVDDQQMPAVDARQQRLARIALPGEHHPARLGVGGQERRLHRLGAGGHRNVAGLPALLKDLHVINAAITEELALMSVKPRGQPREHRLARIEPTGQLTPKRSALGVLPSTPM